MSYLLVTNHTLSTNDTWGSIVINVVFARHQSHTTCSMPVQQTQGSFYPSGHPQHYYGSITGDLFTAAADKCPAVLEEPSLARSKAQGLSTQRHHHQPCERDVCTNHKYAHARVCVYIYKYRYIHTYIHISLLGTQDVHLSTCAPTACTSEYQVFNTTHKYRF